MKKQLKHEVQEGVFTPGTSPSLPSVTNGCEGLPKADGMPYPTVTYVKGPKGKAVDSGYGKE